MRSRTERGQSRRRAGGFTLVELLVAVALMAVLLTMIAQVFQQALESFGMARSSVEVYQNARSSFDLMVRDFGGAKMTDYETKRGYFAIGWLPDAEGGYPVQSITFTTYADQPGARPLIPDVSPQLALVRYTLEFNGGSVTLDDGSQVPAFTLIKQVRFPQIAYFYVDMNEFDESQLTDETVTKDILAMNVLDMRVRVLYKGHYVDVLDHGRATGGGGGFLEDDTKAWPVSLPADSYALLLGGAGAPDTERDITSNTAVQINAAFGSAPSAGNTTYRIENSTGALDPAVLHPESQDVVTAVSGPPEWLSPTSRDEEVVVGTTYADANMYPMIVLEKLFPLGTRGPMDVRMPYVVEITFEMTDKHGRRFHNFTERFHIPASTFTE